VAISCTRRFLAEGADAAGMVAGAALGVAAQQVSTGAAKFRQARHPPILDDAARSGRKIRVPARAAALSTPRRNITNLYEVITSTPPDDNAARRVVCGQGRRSDGPALAVERRRVDGSDE
jgi:hypothetical protein